MIFRILIFLGCAEILLSSHAIEIKVLCDNTQVPTPIDPSNDQVNVVASEETAIIKIQVEHVDDVETECSLSLVDLTVEDVTYMFYYGENKNIREELYSPSDKVGVQFGDDCPFSLSASCVPWTEQEFNYLYENGRKEVYTRPHSVSTFKLTGDHLHQLAYNSSFSTPLDGMILLKQDNEAVQTMMYGRFDSFYFMSTYKQSSAQISTFNTKLNKNGSLGWDVGQEATTTTTTTTTTPKTTVKIESFSVFVLGVNEQNFVSSTIDKFELELTSILESFCTLDDINKPVSFSNKQSCRRSCWMTDQVDRGCVQMDVDLSMVPATASCNITEGNTVTSFFRQKVGESTSNLAKQINATVVYVDDCNEFTVSKPWMLTVIFIGVGSVLFVSGILVVVTVPRYLKSKRLMKQGFNPTNVNEDPLPGKDVKAGHQNDAFEITYAG